MKLYKYLHPDRIDVLKNKSIRFSPPVAFNDPFEFKPVLSGIASSDYFKQYMDEQLDSFIDSVDCIQLSIDLDVFSSSIAPGANMTRMHGVSLSMVEWAIKHIMASGKVKIVDIAELNPEYDYDNQTAKLATKLIQTIVHFV